MNSNLTNHTLGAIYMTKFFVDQIGKFQTWQIPSKSDCVGATNSILNTNFY